jgi:predicted nucleotidyltransferase
MERFGLKESEIQKICAVLKQHPQIRQAIIYGSRALGTQRLASDIDLVLVGQGLDLSLLARIRNELDDLLLPYMIDLSFLQDIDHEPLLDHIKQLGQVFYQA